MATDYVMPTPKDIIPLLDMVFGEGVKVAEAAVTDMSGAYVATYLNRSDELVALCASDMPIVAYSGAALSMIPVGAAEDMISEGEVTQVVKDNHYEVMNIASKLMMSEQSAHLRLDKSLSPNESTEILSGFEPTEVASFELDIPGYGKGTLTFLIS